VDSPVWDQLSDSSKQALRWAAAAARLRADRAGLPVDRVEADEFDLLVGIMLSHPDTSEPRQLLAHIGASAADVLPADYPVPGKDIERYGAQIPADRAPALTSPAAQAVENARRFRVGDVLSLKALFGGLFVGSNRVAATFSDLLGETGLFDVQSSYTDWCGPLLHGDYAEFLADRHPFSFAPVEVPEYKSDKPDTAVAGDDLVDIRAEVDAFAYLLASTSLKPPLAVGLFGDWGSGKTFFMDAVKSRIGQLVESKQAAELPQAALPFWKRIVQIDFNAWHYVKGDLWASLVEHVFAQLRVTGEADMSAVASRQAHWLEQIEAKRSERAEVVEQIDGKKQAQVKAQSDLEDAETRKKEETQKLADLRRKGPADLALTETAKKAVAGLADDVTDGTAGQALDAIAQARAQYQRGTVALGAYPWKRRTTLLAAAALLAVPLLVLVLAQIDSIPVVAQVFAGISAAVAVATKAVRSVTAWAKERLDEYDKAEATIKAEIEKQRAALDEEVRLAAENAAKAAAEVEQLSAKDRRLEAEIAELELLKKTVTSGKLLGEFVAERVGSTDYRKRLGIAALIQRDFDELSRLIQAQNDDLLKGEGGTEPSANTVNRIILYVDDLDRCEPQRVIEVLQAVHLLLAFPLFVVVVAVDSRWLAHSLAEHYPALARQPKSPSASLNGADSEHATPSDYLEKIFQVPFWIEPLGETGRKSLVRGLLQGNLVATGQTEKGEPGGAPLELSEEAQSMMKSMFGRTREVRLETAALGVTATELTYLDGLAPLLGDTPRSIKRFVNVYQLLCALPVPHPLTSELYEQAVAFLLALADGLPALYKALSRELREGTALTLSDVVANAKATLPADEVTRWDEWVEDHEVFAQTPLPQLVEPARRVRRFTFHDDVPASSLVTA
jgi:KAP family P-loop domain